jgi:hypothetical protein
MDFALDQKTVSRLDFTAVLDLAAGLGCVGGIDVVTVTTPPQIRRAPVLEVSGAGAPRHRRRALRSLRRRGARVRRRREGEGVVLGRLPRPPTHHEPRNEVDYPMGAGPRALLPGGAGHAIEWIKLPPGLVGPTLREEKG